MDVHLRLEHDQEHLETALRILQRIEGAVVIWHMRGKKREHPHLHVWHPVNKRLTMEAYMDRLKKLEEFKGFYGNKQWSARIHDNFEKWLEYILRGNKGQRLAINNSKHEIVIPEVELPPTVSEISTQKVTTEISKKLPMRENLSNI